jgi:hypothetical protein
VLRHPPIKELGQGALASLGPGARLASVHVSTDLRADLGGEPVPLVVEKQESHVPTVHHFA